MSLKKENKGGLPPDFFKTGVYANTNIHITHAILGSRLGDIQQISEV